MLIEVITDTGNGFFDVEGYGRRSARIGCHYSSKLSLNKKETN